MIGAILIVMMNARPQGLLGDAGGVRRPPTIEPPRSAVADLLTSTLSLSFGGLRALSELDLQVDDREIVSLIGPNGAGKTTVFNVITGVYQPSSGDIRFAGQLDRRAAAAPDRPAGRRADLPEPAAVPEHVGDRERDGRDLRPHQGDAVGVGPAPAPGPARGARDRALAEDVLSFFGQRLTGYRWDQPAYSLSYANRRRLEIARALATRPRLLLLDEPAAGMNPAETHEITELIGRLRDERGVAILVIEHDMHVVEGCSDRVVALDHGVKIAEGGFDQVAGQPAVVEAYLGRDPEALTDVGVSDAAAEPGERHHLLRADADPGGDLAAGRRGRAGLPARRQRLGQVDDAEDDPRHRAAARGAGAARRRGRDAAGRCPADRQRDGDRAGEPPAVRRR